MKNWVLIKDNKIEAEYWKEEKPTIATTKGIVYEKVFASEIPQPSATEKVVESWEIMGEQYIQSFEVVDKTPLEMWHYPEYAMRIKVAFAAINSNQQLQGFVSQLVLWWNLTKLQHEIDETHSYFYCNFIHDEHQAIVDAFGELIEIENRPTE